MRRPAVTAVVPGVTTVVTQSASAAVVARAPAASRHPITHVG